MDWVRCGELRNMPGLFGSLNCSQPGWQTTMAKLLDQGVDAQDSDFRLIRDDPRFNKQKDLIEDLWERYRSHADPGFQQKIARSFHPHFWEMYLACVLMDRGYQLAPKDDAKGPDICILNADRRLWVEAVAPGCGEGADAVPVPRIDSAEYAPVGRIILRLRSAIEEKWQKYKSYVTAGILSPTEPYVIAVNGGYVPEVGAIGSGLPYIVQAVSGLGSQYVSLDRNTLEIVDQGYSDLPFVQKAAGAQVPTGIFVDGGYAGVSAVLYSGVRIRSLPVGHGSEFVLVHNETATNPLTKGWVGGSEFWSENGTWYSRDNQHRRG